MEGTPIGSTAGADVQDAKTADTVVARRISAFQGKPAMRSPRRSEPAGSPRRQGAPMRAEQHQTKSNSHHARTTDGAGPDVASPFSLETPRDPNAPEVVGQQVRGGEQGEVHQSIREANTAPPATRVPAKVAECVAPNDDDDNNNDKEKSPWRGMRMLLQREFWSALGSGSRDILETQIMSCLDLAGILSSVAGILFAVFVMPWILFLKGMGRRLQAAVSVEASSDSLEEASLGRQEHQRERSAAARARHGTLRRKCQRAYDSNVGDANAQAVCWGRAMVAAAPEDRTGVAVDPQINNFEPAFLSWWLRLAVAVFRRFPVIMSHFKNRAGLVLTLRTLLFDQLFETAVKSFAVRQIVILGAGYDSRALRFAALRRQYGVRVIEIDQSSVQRRKIECLRKLKGMPSGDPSTPTKDQDFNSRTSRRGSRQDLEGVSSDVAYCPCNFESTNALREALLEGGFNPELTTAFFMEGVSYYLTLDAMKSTLSTIAGFRRGSATGSTSPGSGCGLFLPEWYLYFDYFGTKSGVSTTPSFDATFVQMMALAMKLRGTPLRLALPTSRVHVAEVLASSDLADFKVDKTTTFLQLVDRFCPNMYTLFCNTPFLLAECRWPPVSLLPNRNNAPPQVASPNHPTGSVSAPLSVSKAKPAS